MSIKLKLLLIVTTALLTVGLLTASFVYVQNNQRLSNHAQGDIENTINYTFQLVNAYFGRVSGITDNLAKDTTIVSALKEKNAEKYNQINDKFTTITESNTILERLVLFEIINEQCVIRAINKSGIELLNKDFSDRDYCKGVLKYKSSYISSAFIGSTTKHPNIAIVSPVINEENILVGFVLGAVNVNELRGYLWDLQNNSKIEILDRNGVMFLDTSKKITKLSNLDITENVEIKHILENLKTGKNQGSYYDGTNFVGYKSDNSFTVIYEKSLVEIGLLEKNVTLTVFFAQFLSIIITTSIIYFFVEKVTKKISRLSTIARQISREQFNVKLSEKDLRGKDETAILAQAFDIMITKLSDSYKNLEEKVKVRTRVIAEAESRDKAILTSIGEAVVACDKNEKIFLFNSSAVFVTGFSVQEAIGSNYKKILNFIEENNTKSQYDFISETLKLKKLVTVKLDTKIIKKSGEYVPIAGNSSPIFGENNEVIGAVTVFRDNTVEKQIDKAKTEFVSLASHQLRTPLTSINWTAEMFLNGDFGKISDKQKQSIEGLYKSGKRMANLINALLNVSRIEMGKFEINTKSLILIKLIEESLEELKLVINTKNIKIIKKFAKSISPITADEVLLKIVFVNILSNAIRYSNNDSEVVVTVEQNSKNILTTVENYGIGISKQDYSKVFTKLFRAVNARLYEPDGTGLGLYLVKSILDETGGKVWFDSVENKVTKFYIELPLEGMKPREGRNLI